MGTACQHTPCSSLTRRLITVSVTSGDFQCLSPLWRTAGICDLWFHRQRLCPLLLSLITAVESSLRDFGPSSGLGLLLSLRWLVLAVIILLEVDFVSVSTVRQIQPQQIRHYNYRQTLKQTQLSTIRSKYNRKQVTRSQHNTTAAESKWSILKRRLCPLVCMGCTWYANHVALYTNPSSVLGSRSVFERQMTPMLFVLWGTFSVEQYLWRIQCWSGFHFRGKHNVGWV